MSITSVQKTSLLVGILAIAGVGAFVYFDPLDLDLLGLKQKPAVLHPASPTHGAVPAAQPPAAALKPTVTPAQAKTSSAALPTKSPAPVATSPVAVPKVAIAPAQVKPPPAATPSPNSAPVTVAPVAPVPGLATDQSPQQPMKLSKETGTSKPAAEKPARPKNLDLRYCLDLETDAAIAKCAGE
jgi:hypothetical protein